MLRWRVAWMTCVRELNNQASERPAHANISNPIRHAGIQSALWVAVNHKPYITHIYIYTYIYVYPLKRDTYAEQLVAHHDQGLSVDSRLSRWLPDARTATHGRLLSRLSNLRTSMLQSLKIGVFLLKLKILHDPMLLNSHTP